MKRLFFMFAGLALLMSGCAAKQAPKDFTAFRSADPHSILVVPVINRSAEVEAADLFLSTLSVPLAERGFYVFPVNMTKSIMESDGLGDANLVHGADTTRLAELFGADSVLYVEILNWESQYAITAANINVEFVYTLKDGQTGELLWQEQQAMQYSRSGSGGGLLANLIATAITSAIDSTRSDFTPVAQQANAVALLTPGLGLPSGPYSPNYGKDEATFPSTGTGYISDATIATVAYPIIPAPPPDAADAKASEASGGEDAGSSAN